MCIYAGRLPTGDAIAIVAPHMERRLARPPQRRVDAAGRIAVGRHWLLQSLAEAPRIRLSERKHAYVRREILAFAASKIAERDT
jgi:hypothetical protein